MINQLETESRRDRVMIFIDGPQFDQTIQTLKIEIDYHRLIQFLAGDWEITGVLYFQLPENIDNNLRSKLNALNAQIMEEMDRKKLNKRIIHEISSRRCHLNHIVMVGGNSSFASVIQSSVMSYQCSVSIFCIKEYLYPSYKNLLVKIIDPREYLQDISFNRNMDEKKLIEIPNTIPRERVVILVDAANIMPVLGKEKITIDFLALRRILTERRDLVGSFYYHGTPVPQYLDKFYRYLESVRYTLVPFNGTNVDPLIKTHITQIAAQKKVNFDGGPSDRTMIEANSRIDTIILIGGDSDYLEELENAVDQYGIKVEIVSFHEALFKPYLGVSEFKVTLLDDIMEQIIWNRPADNNGRDNPLSETISIAPVPEPNVPISEEPKIEQLIDSLVHFLTHNPVEEFHLVLNIKDKQRKVDIV